MVKTDKKYWVLGIFFILLTLNVLNMTLNSSNDLLYLYFNQPFMLFTAIIPAILATICFIMIKKNNAFREKKEKVDSILNDSLEHEDDISHDENEEPIMFVDEKKIESLEHEDDVSHDKNEEPVTFVEEKNDEN